MYKFCKDISCRFNVETVMLVISFVAIFALVSAVLFN